MLTAALAYLAFVALVLRFFQVCSPRREKAGSNRSEGERFGLQGGDRLTVGPAVFIEPPHASEVPHG